MNLQIGTILIAKDYHYTEKGIKAITKNKEYPINSMDELTEIIFYGYVNDLGMKESVTKAYIEDNFIIKRYTLQDLKDKKIAVKLRSEEEFNKLSKLLGNSENFKCGEYHDFFLMQSLDWRTTTYCKKNNYTLLESIDLIDLEVKEEVLIATDADCVERIQQLESEINRLKEENEELETALRVTTKKLGIANSQDQSKRERMAWELFLRDDELSIDGVFNTVDLFLAKSKEVKDDKGI